MHVIILQQELYTNRKSFLISFKYPRHGAFLRSMENFYGHTLKKEKKKPESSFCDERQRSLTFKKCQTLLKCNVNIFLNRISRAVFIINCNCTMILFILQRLIKIAVRREKRRKRQTEQTDSNAVYRTVVFR